MGMDREKKGEGGGAWKMWARIGRKRVRGEGRRGWEVRRRRVNAFRICIEREGKGSGIQVSDSFLFSFTKSNLKSFSFITF